MPPSTAVFRAAPSAGHLRVEVTNARGEVHPQARPAGAEPEALHPAGRGPLPAAALTDHWDCVPVDGGPVTRGNLNVDEVADSAPVGEGADVGADHVQRDRSPPFGVSPGDLNP